MHLVLSEGELTLSDFENACKSLCSSPHLCTGVRAHVLNATGSLVLLFSKFIKKVPEVCCWHGDGDFVHVVCMHVGVTLCVKLSELILILAR